MLLCFIALTTVICGVIMIYQPGGQTMGLPLSILDTTMFKNFLIPGILLTAVGLVNSMAVFYNIQRHPNRYNWAIAGGVMMCGWIIVQMILIQTFYWLQFFYLGIGLLVILIAYQLKGKWAV